MAYRYGSSNKSYPCKVCTPLPGPWPVVEKFHRHYSTRYYLTTAKSKGQQSVDCVACGVRHAVDIPDRLKIISSTSTLCDVPLSIAQFRAGPHFL